MKVEDHQYFVYIMSSYSCTLYIGMTTAFTAELSNIKIDRSKASPANTLAPAWSTMKVSTTSTVLSGEKKN
jgi:hypothetical protein